MAERRTDHSITITNMRERAQTLISTKSERKRERGHMINLAADLLEMHDATGISLDKWPTALIVVKASMVISGQAPTVQPNGA